MNRGTSNGRRSRKKRTYTPEQIAEWEARDNALRAAVKDVLDDADAVTAIITRLMRVTSARVLGYSLRNQVMLYLQARERGFELTDVDTFAGWCKRGRVVREGQTGLRIVAPRGRDDKHDPDDDDTRSQPPTEPNPDGQGDKPKRGRFGMTKVFDVWQTTELTDDEHDHTNEPRPELLEPEPVDDPAGFLRANLVQQIEDQGHTVPDT
ncbi:ArdC-like ssDNA-binding domain-containing protein, partial [Kibdelosporangium lantanae]